MGAATAHRAFAEGASIVAVDLNKAGLDVLEEELGDPVAGPDRPDGRDRSRPDRGAWPMLPWSGSGRPTAWSTPPASPWWGHSSTSTRTAGSESWRSTSTARSTRVGPSLREMVDAEAPGAIVNFSSGAGIRGVANRIGYVASKFAVTGMTYTMALELAPTWHSGQRRRSGDDADPAHGVHVRGPGERPHGSRRRTRSAAPASRTRSRTPSCSFSARRPASSPGSVLTVDGGTTIGIGNF